MTRRAQKVGLWNFSQMAEESGINRQTLMNWHKGKHKPDPHKWDVWIGTLERLERQAERRAK